MRDYQRIYNVIQGDKVLYHGDYDTLSKCLGINKKVVHNIANGKRRKKYSIKEVGYYRKIYVLESEGETIKMPIEELTKKFLCDKNYVFNRKVRNKSLYGWTFKKIIYQEVMYDR